MDAPHKLEPVKLCCAWMGVGGAKMAEHLHDPIAFFMGLSLSDWAALLAIVYSAMQISLLFPKWARTVRGWFHAFF